MSMGEVMKRGGRGHLVNEPFNKTRMQRVMSHVTPSRIVNGSCFDVKLDHHLGLLSRCLSPELMDEEMTL
jgi:hypothetical protein